MRWRTSLPRMRALLADFGTHSQPISMAASAEIAMREKRF
jgi:hypothetical protein